jgi:hypothetical protein
MHLPEKLSGILKVLNATGKDIRHQRRIQRFIAPKIGETDPFRHAFAAMPIFEFGVKPSIENAA